MKRTRDDIDASRSQDKRPRGTPQSESLGEEMKTTAILFVKEIKETFHDQIDKYRMFLEILRDCKENRMDTSAAIARVNELFKGHNNLILRLTHGFDTTLDDEEDDASSNA